MNVATIDRADTLLQKDMIESDRRQVPEAIRFTLAAKNDLQMNRRRACDQIEDGDAVGRWFIDDESDFQHRPVHSPKAGERS